MFGGKNEDYDAYNEKASSKYDDYGTSETEVYSDDGLYEQTFTDNQTTLEKFFADKLDTDERLIWTGSMKRQSVAIFKIVDYLYYGVICDMRRQDERQEDFWRLCLLPHGSRQAA